MNKSRDVNNGTASGSNSFKGNTPSLGLNKKWGNGIPDQVSAYGSKKVVTFKNAKGMK